MINRLHIHELSLTGLNKKTSTIAFQIGLNVISGASDTGKTFIYQCLAYMLGGKEPPKTVPELDGYTTLKLLIGTPDSPVYEFSRSLSGGDFLVKALSGQAAEAKNRNQVFEMLADYLGIGGKKLKKNKHNETVRMSFAAIRRFIMSDEGNIISETSPILSQHYTRHTEDKAAFKFVLSGLDDSALIKSADNSHDVLRKTGKRIAFDDVISSLKSKVGESDRDEIEEQKKNLEGNIAALIDELASKTSSGSLLVDKKSKTVLQISAIDERIFSLNNSLVRFDLLHKTYQTDIDRIQFVVEGKGLFEQLNVGKCPYCGSRMDHVHMEDQVQKVDLENLEAASKVELVKINLLIGDLNQSIGDLKSELSKLESQKQNLGDEIRKIELELSSSVEQEVTRIKNKIRELSGVRDEVQEISLAHNELLEVEKRKADSLAMNYSQGDEEEEKFNQDLALNELCKILESILKEWKISENPRVSFNLEQYDIVIDGKARRSWGKGFRAILLTAFLTGLRKLAVQRGTFHPGIIILDSPLTTHEEVDRVDSGIQEAVFRSLAVLPETQIILIDNKTPPEDLSSKIMHIHYSGIKGSTNQGFVPGY